MDTETTCHCGADYQGSDHCPACGCEQYEGGCDHRAALSPHAGPQPLEAEVLSTLSRTPAASFFVADSPAPYQEAVRFVHDALADLRAGEEFDPEGAISNLEEAVARIRAAL